PHQHTPVAGEAGRSPALTRSRRWGPPHEPERPSRTRPHPRCRGSQRRNPRGATLAEIPPVHLQREGISCHCPLVDASASPLSPPPSHSSPPGPPGSRRPSPRPWTRPPTPLPAPPPRPPAGWQTSSVTTDCSPTTPATDRSPTSV